MRDIYLSPSLASLDTFYPLGPLVVVRAKICGGKTFPRSPFRAVHSSIWSTVNLTGGAGDLRERKVATGAGPQTFPVERHTAQISPLNGHLKHVRGEA